MKEIKTKMMTEKVDPREVTEKKFEEKKRRENIVAQTLFGRFEDKDSSAFNPNRY